MVRKYVSDRHRENAEKLRKLESELGLTDTPTPVPDPDPQQDPNSEDPVADPVPDPGQEPPADDPQPEPPAGDPEPVVDTPPTPSKKPGEHDWAKREADAKEAQRKLSVERNKLDQTIRDMEARAKAQEEQQKRINDMLAQIDAKLAAPTPTPAFEMPKFEPDEDIAALERDLPEVSKLTDAKTKQLLTPLLQKLEAMEKKERDRDVLAAKAEEDRKLAEGQRQAEALMGEIQKEHPDAFEVASSADFQEWLDKQPPSWKDIVVNTYKYTAKDASYVLGEYKRGTTPTPDPPPAATPKGPDSRPRIRTAPSDVKHGGNAETYTMEQLRDKTFMNTEMQRDLKKYRAKLDLTLKNQNLSSE